jgi:hypothetical protein
MPAVRSAPDTAMTQTERKQRSEKSAVIVARLVRAQLRAMGCQRFDLGIKRDAGEMILREGQGPIEIEEAIKWLRHENAKGAHIYIRAAGSHNLTLIDDLAIEAVERMKGEGLEPAVVVETSPNNFQASVTSLVEKVLRLECERLAAESSRHSPAHHCHFKLVSSRSSFQAGINR